MGYQVYFKDGGRRYKLPVNPEEVKKSQSLEIETKRVLGGKQVSVPVGQSLASYDLKLELPARRTSYMNPGTKASPDYYINMLKRAQKGRRAIRLIYSNGITEDESAVVLVKDMTVTEKAGEDGDKYVDLKLQQHAPASKRFVAVQVPKKPDTAVKQTQEQPPSNPAAETGKEYTVTAKDTLWKIAKQFYGNGALYPKIYNANRDKIKNPNIIRPGQVLKIPT